MVKKGIRPEPKMSPRTRSMVLKMKAEGFNSGEIVRFLDKEGLEHPTQGRIMLITKAPKYQAELQKYREDYLASIDEVPVSHKRIRLERVEKTYKMLDKLLTKMLDTKGAIKRKDFKNCMTLVKRFEELLARAQDEMERKPAMVVSLTQNMRNTSISDEELIVERNNILRRIKELESQGIQPADRTIQDDEQPAEEED